MSLKHGFDQINRIPGGIKTVGKHTFHLAKYLYLKLSNLKYENDAPFIHFYSQYESAKEQGGICNFNILNPDGSYVGFTGN